MLTKIKTIRIQRGISQRKLGQLLGVHWVILSGIENAIRRPSLVHKAKLAQFFGIPEEELFSDFWERKDHESALKP